MKHYIYQMYDESLQSFIMTNVLDATPEQMKFSVRSASIKKPETLVGKDSCKLFLAGEIDVESGIITIYESKELIFDYVAFCEVKRKAELKVANQEGEVEHA